MELINRIRKNRKGFTLVEIIVVLVILAIIAAFTIPAMLGFVNEAKEKAIVAEAREVYVASQASLTEYNATHATAFTNGDYANTATDAVVAQTNSYLSTDLSGATWTITVAGNKITKVVYTRGTNTYTLTPSNN